MLRLFLNHFSTCSDNQYARDTHTHTQHAQGPDERGLPLAAAAESDSRLVSAPPPARPPVSGDGSSQQLAPSRRLPAVAVQHCQKFAFFSPLIKRDLILLFVVRQQTQAQRRIRFERLLFPHIWDPLT